MAVVCRNLVRRCVLVLVAGALAAAGGCSYQFPVPDEAGIACSEATDCPDGWKCNPRVGLCVKRENVDEEPPRLVGEVRLAPRILKDGAVATLTFETSEDLFQEPVVTLDAGTARPLRYDATASSGRRYVFTYQAAGVEPEGVEAPISIVLTDKFRNQSEALPGPGLAFDFAAPEVSRVTVAGTPARQAGVVRLSFKASEPLGSDPVVRLALPSQQATLTKDPSSKDQDYEFTYTATGLEDEDPAGFALTISLVDRAGNPAEVEVERRVAFDSTPPALVGTPGVTPRFAREQATVEVRFDVSEDLGADPVVLASGAPMVKSAAVGRGYLYRMLVGADAAEGARDVTVALVDRAGNVFGPAGVGSFTVDRTSPRLTGHDVAPGPFRSPRAGEAKVVAAVSLEASEPLDPAKGGVHIWIGPGAEAACPSGAATSHACVFEVPVGLGPGDPLEGQRVVVAELIDEAGNSVVETLGTIELDFTPPQVGSSNASPTPAKVGDRLAYAVVPTERLAGPPTPMGAGAAALTYVPGTTYLFTHPVAAGDPDGTFNPQFAMTDLAGNSTAASAGVPFTIDAHAPALGPLTMDRAAVSRAPGFDTLTVRFACDEDLGSRLQATVGGAPMDCDPWLASAPNYTCRYRTRSADTEGTREVVVQAADAAGNVATERSAVTFDFTAPWVASSNASPTPAKIGALLAYAVVPSEPLAGAPTPLGASAATLTYVPGTTYLFTHPVASGDPDGTFNPQFAMTDLAGNATAASAGVPFTIDAHAPALGPLALDRVAVSRAQGFDTLTVRFACDEDLGSRLQATVGGIPMECDPWVASAPNYACRYRVGTTDTEGAKEVVVFATDAAGNPATERSAVTFDFTAPRVASSNASPTPAKIGDLLAYAVVPSEPLAGPPTPLGASAAALTYVPGTTYLFTHPVAAGDPDGTFNPQFAMTDLAGNSNAASAGEPFTIDAHAPALGPLALDRAAVSRAQGFDTLTVRFACDEDLGARLQATVGGAPMDCDPWAASAPNYACRYRVGATDTEGAKEVVVFATDAAGNPATKRSAVTFDFTPAAIVIGSTALQLVPDYPATNPLASVTAATNGTLVRVGFSLTEPVSPDPKVMTQTTGKELTLVSKTGLLYQYEVVLAGLPILAAYPEQVEIAVTPAIVDAAGNAPDAELPIATVTIDTKAPDPIMTWVPDLVVYRRTPWGSDATGGQKRFTVAGGAGALPADATRVFAFDGQTAAPSLVVGSQQRRGDGGFDELVLLGSDRARVFVAAADAAGNLSVASEVADGVWTATLGQKVPGSTFENPLVFEDRTWFLPRPSQGDAVERGAAEGLAATGGGVVATPGGGTWVQAARPWDVGARHGHAMAFDPLRGKLVVIGGAGKESETWEYDGSWRRVFPFDPEGDGNPALAVTAPAAWDPLTGAVYFFDAKSSRGLHSSWWWDGVSYRSIPGDFTYDPQAREGSALAFDTARGHAVMFGGGLSSFCDNYRIASYCGGTWQLRTETNPASWAQWNPWGPIVSPIPPPRANHAMAYDQKNRVTVMFGGCSAQQDSDGQSCTRVLGDTWTFDASMESGVQSALWASVGGAGPSPRGGHAMAYDPVRERVVLFGGCAAPLSYINARQCVAGGLADTWEWNGTGWSAPTITDPEGDGAPAGRLSHALAYDPQLGGVVLYGGCTTCTAGDLDDLWLWNGQSWKRLGPTSAAGPSPRGDALLAYDSARKKVVLFGGTGGSQTDTWEWDGVRWALTVVAPANRTPPVYTGPPYVDTPAGRGDHALAYDASRQRTVLFGGGDGYSNSYGHYGYAVGTWEYDGTRWQDVSPATSPEPRRFAAMVHVPDPVTPYTLLYGGISPTCPGWKHPSYALYYCQDVWAWTGVWTQLTVTDPEVDGGPSPRYGAFLAWDPVRGRVLLHGGYGAYAPPDDRTWEWTGSSWRRVTPDFEGPLGSSSQGSQQALVFEAGRGAPGFYYGTTAGRFWWLGTDAWSQGWTGDPEGDGMPAPRGSNGLAFDAARAQTVLFGGMTAASNKLGDTWLYDAGQAGRPAHVLRVPFAVAGVPTSKVRGVEVSWRAGGSGPGGPGAALQRWALDRFVAAGPANAASAQAPEVLQFSASSGVGSLFRGTEQMLEWAVQPISANGNGGSVVATDYVEVRVRYRR